MAHQQQVQDQAREVQGQAREQAQGLFQKVKARSPGWLGLLALGGAAAVVAAVVLGPVFLFFSPVLVPLGILLFLCTAGLATAGASALAAGSAITWLYRYLKGRHPLGSDRIDHAIGRLHDTTGHVDKHKARDLAGQTHSTVQEAVTPGA